MQPSESRHMGTVRDGDCDDWHCNCTCFVWPKQQPNYTFLNCTLASAKRTSEKAHWHHVTHSRENEPWNKTMDTISRCPPTHFFPPVHNPLTSWGGGVERDPMAENLFACGRGGSSDRAPSGPAHSQKPTHSQSCTKRPVGGGGASRQQHSPIVEASGLRLEVEWRLRLQLRHVPHQSHQRAIRLRYKAQKVPIVQINAPHWHWRRSRGGSNSCPWWVGGRGGCPKK